MFSCPLDDKDQRDLYQGIKALLPKCRRVCPYWGHMGDYVLPNCVQLVVALLDPERRAAVGLTKEAK